MNYLKDKASAVRECGVEKLPVKTFEYF